MHVGTLQHTSINHWVSGPRSACVGGLPILKAQLTFSQRAMKHTVIRGSMQFTVLFQAPGESTISESMQGH